jgi:hypothetical protein
MWNERLVVMENQSMNLTYLMLVAWMFLLQHVFNAIFAGKNKRVPHLAHAGSFLDFAIFFIGLIYVIIVYKNYRWNTWLQT